MILFQAIKTAGKATEIVATYKNIATGKEYHRHLMKREDGKVFDPMMNSNPGSESAWTTQERWKARLGLNQEKFEFSFGGKAEEKPAKQAEQNAFVEKAGAPPSQVVKKATGVPAGKISLKQVVKKAKQEPLTYDQYLEVLKNQPFFGGDVSFRAQWEIFLKKISEKAYDGKSISEIAYQYGKKHDVDPKLVLAYIFVESRGDVDAESKEHVRGTNVLKPADEQSWGLMQIIPKLHGISVDAAKNPSINVDRSTKYVASNLKAYPGKAPLQVLGHNKGTAGAGNFEKNGYALKSEKETDNANKYVSKVLQTYKLLTESKYDGHKDERAGTFLKSQDYKAAMEKCERNAKGGYLADFDFSKPFTCP